jgi:hypothetical protein
MAALDRCMIEKKLETENLCKEEKNVLVQEAQEQSIRADLFPRRAAPRDNNKCPTTARAVHSFAVVALMISIVYNNTIQH